MEISGTVFVDTAYMLFVAVNLICVPCHLYVFVTQGVETHLHQAVKDGMEQAYASMVKPSDAIIEQRMKDNPLLAALEARGSKKLGREIQNKKPGESQLPFLLLGKDSVPVLARVIQDMATGPVKTVLGVELHTALQKEFAQVRLDALANLDV